MRLPQLTVFTAAAVIAAVGLHFLINFSLTINAELHPRQRLASGLRNFGTALFAKVRAFTVT